MNIAILIGRAEVKDTQIKILKLLMEKNYVNILLLLQKKVNI